MPATTERRLVATGSFHRDSERRRLASAICISLRVLREMAAELGPCTGGARVRRPRLLVGVHAGAARDRRDRVRVPPW
jgi:hypothetical protein